ncbi:hypothetical protein [Novosphingobium sp. ES2-1]|uniref:hypothetical protein n=1 Tax=Novosphingobium sp. ES2-1 TaxID=2780074 RepID=UPI001882E8D7|nr:hypothetical protein [Novosphingobium sp. ES2-1]QOV93444.1 hypothetical protein IM701_12570 [Novosphingobium sp. ES2-1]
MSGRGISGLGMPPMQYRVDLWCPGFETAKASTMEDLSRGEGLCRAVRDYPGKIDRPEGLRLATSLMSEEPTGSLASSVAMRSHRIKVCGHIWQLIRKVKTNKVRTFTIVPATWEYPADRLMEADPAAMINGLRAALYGRGAGQASGWLIAFVHSEHDPIADVYRFHVHGFAHGGMIEVVDRLRSLPNYRSRLHLPDGSRNPVYRRVRRARKGLRNLPAPVTYLLQSFWPARAVISKDGSRFRVRRKGRIKEPRHSQVLMWLDKHRLEDITLMIGLRVTKDGLKQTKPVS